MAGMLPGVECARRRRFHQGGWNDSLNVSGSNGRTRRSSFCLYTSNNETHLSSSSSVRNTSNQDEKLEGVAREAKDRLDEKLRNQRKSLDPKRPSIKDNSKKNSEESGRVLGSVVVGDLKEVPGIILKRSNSKKFCWAKFGWKSSNQEECVVCLERFESNEPLVSLPCAHRFHSRCLVPWLETNAHCPCCRLGLMLS